MSFRAKRRNPPISASKRSRNGDCVGKKRLAMTCLSNSRTAVIRPFVLGLPSFGQFGRLLYLRYQRVHFRIWAELESRADLSFRANASVSEKSGLSAAILSSNTQISLRSAHRNDMSFSPGNLAQSLKRTLARRQPCYYE